MNEASFFANTAAGFLGAGSALALIALPAVVRNRRLGDRTLAFAGILILISIACSLIALTEAANP